MQKCHVLLAHSKRSKNVERWTLHILNECYISQLWKWLKGISIKSFIAPLTCGCECRHVVQMQVIHVFHLNTTSMYVYTVFCCQTAAVSNVYLQTSQPVKSHFREVSLTSTPPRCRLKHKQVVRCKITLLINLTIFTCFFQRLFTCTQICQIAFLRLNRAKPFLFFRLFT